MGGEKAIVEDSHLSLYDMKQIIVLLPLSGEIRFYLQNSLINYNVYVSWEYCILHFILWNGNSHPSTQLE